MNKIVQINLGGYALTIDEDAYRHLKAYLDDIRQRLGQRQESDEIMRDIEMRLGELITDRLSGRTIAELADVEAAIEVMGKPEDFGAKEGGSERVGERGGFRPGRRLYRDESDAVIGGVCSGLAAYFGLSDPIWIRVVFLLLTLISFGFWVPAYVLLWILVPPARTAAERLAMRGEHPNVENIVREVEQGAERLSRRAAAFGREAGEKIGPASRSIASGCATFLTRFFKGVAIFIAAGLVLSLGAVWAVGTVLFLTSPPEIAALNPLPQEGAYLAFVNLFFLVGIPVIALAIWLVRTIFRFRAPAWLGLGMAVLWLLNLFSLGGLVTWGAMQYREEGQISRPIDLGSVTSDTLYLRLGEDVSRPDGSGIRVRRGKAFFGAPTISVKRGTSTAFEGSYRVYARGKTEEAAQEYAGSVPFEANVTGNVLTLPAAVHPGREGWRAQRVTVQIEVPQGKYIVFAQGAHRLVWAEYVDDAQKATNHPGAVFQMTALGLMCTDCAFSEDEQDAHGSVDYFILEGQLDVDITQDEEFRLHCPDQAAPKPSISVVRKGRTLILSPAKGQDKMPVRCSIHTPEFTSLVVNGQGQVSLSGFEEGRSTVVAKGPVRVRGLYRSDELKVVLSDQAALELVGEGTRLDAVLSNYARLEAGAWRVSEAQIIAAHHSQAQVHAEESINVHTDATSSVQTGGKGTFRRM